MLDSCLMPELAAEITLQPVRRHHVDAAIFFSDIVVPLKLAGVDVDIVPGVGPVIAHPVRTAADLSELAELESSALEPITAAVALTVAELGTTPLVGFAGAPFTVASYLIEGRPSRDYAHTRNMMRTDPGLWHAVLAWVGRTTGTFLRAQALAGASALQLFDSWAGALSQEQYREFVLPHSTAVFDAVKDLPVPRVHFGTKTEHLLIAMREAGATVMGVDQFTPLDVASAMLGDDIPLQGNIDPALLSGSWEALTANVIDVIDRGKRAPGHVVNLGHGVPPETDPQVLTDMVAFIHEYQSPEGQ